MSFDIVPPGGGGVNFICLPQGGKPINHKRMEVWYRGGWWVFVKAGADTFSD